MAKISLKIKGLDELKKKLGKVGQKQVLKEVEDEFKATAQKIRNLAIKKVSVNEGYLRNSIDIESTGQFGWAIFAKANYAAYLEFGTRTKVDVPAEMQEMATQFKNQKNGDWDAFEESIKKWVKQKGIVPQHNGKDAVDPDDQDYADMIFLIMLSIYKNGISPKPFLYPSYKEGTKEIQKRIDNIINRYLNK